MNYKYFYYFLVIAISIIDLQAGTKFLIHLRFSIVLFSMHFWSK